MDTLKMDAISFTQLAVTSGGYITATTAKLLASKTQAGQMRQTILLVVGPLVPGALKQQVRPGTAGRRGGEKYGRWGRGGGEW